MVTKDLANFQRRISTSIKVTKDKIFLDVSIYNVLMLAKIFCVLLLMR